MNKYTASMIAANAAEEDTVQGGTFIGTVRPWTMETLYSPVGINDPALMESLSPVTRPFSKTQGLLKIGTHLINPHIVASLSKATMFLVTCRRRLKKKP